MNAASDRLDDSFPHGTPAGYRQGCCGEICPSADEHGLSCKKASALAAGDYGYQKLAKRGLTPGEIAIELGLIPERPTASAIPKPKPPAPPVVPAPNLAQAEHVTAQPAPPAATPEPVPAAKPKRKSPTGPSQVEVRAWARANGIDVNPRGNIRTDVVDAYLARDQTQGIVLPDYAAHLAEPHPDDATPTTHAEATAELIDQVRDRIDMPKPAPVTVPAPERPEWADVTISEAVTEAIADRDRARELAAKLCDQLEQAAQRATTAENALALALTRWDKTTTALAAAELHHLKHVTLSGLDGLIIDELGVQLQEERRQHTLTRLLLRSVKGARRVAEAERDAAIDLARSRRSWWNRGAK